MNPTVIAIAISAALAGSAGFGAAWTLQGRTIDALRIEAKDAIITQQRAARKVAERLTAAVTEAQAKAVSRNASNRRDADRAASSGNGLRLASTTAVRASSTDLETCTRSLDAHSVVLSESISAIRELAAEADAWASHAVTLQDAWPKVTSINPLDVK